MAAVVDMDGLVTRYIGPSSQLAAWDAEGRRGAFAFGDLYNFAAYTAKDALLTALVAAQDVKDLLAYGALSPEARAAVRAKVDAPPVADVSPFDTVATDKGFVRVATGEVVNSNVPASFAADAAPAPTPNGDEPAQGWGVAGIGVVVLLFLAVLAMVFLGGRRA